MTASLSVSAVPRVLQAAPFGSSKTYRLGEEESYCSWMSEVCCGALNNQQGFESTALSFGPTPTNETVVVAKNPDDVHSVDVQALKAAIAGYDLVHVHQCLTAVGLLIASEARLQRKVVIGTHYGGEGHKLLREFPHMADVYNGFHALSGFAAHAFANFRVPVRVIPGPVDDGEWPGNGRPPVVPQAARHRRMISVGHIQSQNSFETIIDALDAHGPSLQIYGRQSDPHYYEFLRLRAKGKPVEFKVEWSEDDLVQVLSDSELYIHAATTRDFRGAPIYRPELVMLAPLVALSRGTRTLVSRIGSLAELASFEGCEAFGDHLDLRSKIELAFASSALIDPNGIRAQCVARYGLASFGEQYRRWIKELLDAHSSH